MLETTSIEEIVKQFEIGGLATVMTTPSKTVIFSGSTSMRQYPQHRGDRPEIEPCREIPVTFIKNITCNLERNKIKYKQLNHIAITPILRGKPSKGKTTNNRSIINLDQTGQAGPSELATTHLQATLQWSISSLI